MTFLTVLRLAVAETRRSRGRLAFSILSISIGVFSLTAIRTALDSLEGNINSQARSLMGADLLIHSPRPFGKNADVLFDELMSAGAKSAGIIEFYSMLYETGPTRGARSAEADGSGRKRNEDATRLVRVRAVSGPFPLEGAIDTSPPGRWDSLIAGRSPIIIPDGDVLEFLEIKPGSRVFLGRMAFRVEGSFLKRPGSPVSGFGFAPAVYINERYLAWTGLMQTGSRARYSRYFRLPANFPIEEWKKKHWDDATANDLTIQTYRESAESLQRFLMRLSNFLTAVGLITLLLGGLGIGATMNVFMKDRLDHAAILRSLGATPQQVFYVYFSLAVLLGLAGSLLGVIPGALAPLAVSETAATTLAGTLLPVKLQIRFSLAACLEAAGTGLGAALLFTLLPIYRIRNVSPLRVLRHSEAPPRDIAVHAVLLVAIFLFILGITGTQTGSLTTALAFTAGIAASLLLVYTLSRLIVKGTLKLGPRIRSFHLRHGIANLHRPGNQTTAAITAAGMGMLLMSTILVMEASIQKEIALEQQPDTPNLFLVDIQPSQREATESLMRQSGLKAITISPMVSARIVAVNGKAVSRKIEEQNAAKRTWEDTLRTREYFVSYRDHLLPSEELTAGAFWTGRPPSQEISVEESWASTMHVSMGDRLTLDIQGIPLLARVTSLRKIRWQAMRPNSILLLSPGEIEEAPRMYVASARYVDHSMLAAFRRRLVARNPNISVIDAMEAVENVRFILDRISFVVRFMAAVTLFNGILILVGAIASGRYARLREAMLFKVLGATEGDIRRILVSEYAALAFLGGLTGWLLSEAINRPLLAYFFEASPTVPVGSLFALLAGIVFLNTATGLWISRDVGHTRPMDILREE